MAYKLKKIFCIKSKKKGFMQLVCKIAAKSINPKTHLFSELVMRCMVLTRRDKSIRQHCGPL